MTAERWRQVPGWPRYFVSDLGNVRGPRGLLKPFRTANLYWHVSVYAGGIKTTMPLHQLVMLAHVGKPPPGCEVLHRDDDKDDNRLSSLRYGTHAENMADLARSRQAAAFVPLVLTGTQLALFDDVA